MILLEEVHRGAYLLEVMTAADVTRAHAIRISPPPRNKDEAIAPITRMRLGLECGLQCANDRAKLVMSKPHDHSAAMVRLTGLQPPTADARKVGHVEGHEDASLGVCKL